MSEHLATKFFVYYDKKTNHILSVTNELHAVFEDKIEVSAEVYERLVTGIDKFSDFRVSPSQEGVFELVSIIKDRYCFNYKLLTQIKNKPTSDSNIVVEWHKKTKVWKFSFSKLPLVEVPHKVIIFATLNNDYDFLVRTFEIDINELIGGEIYIPFDNKFENDISNLNIFTKTSILSYGLLIVNE